MLIQVLKTEYNKMLSDNMVSEAKENEISKKVWQSMIRNAIDICYGDETFATYTAREQMLAFAYTLFQMMATEEEFLTQLKLFQISNYSILKDEARDFFNKNIDYGMAIGEIQARTWISSRYSYLLVSAILTLCYLWSKDTSESKEQTDAGIDKIINWVYDIMQPNALDSGVGVMQYLVEIIQQHGRTK